MRNAVLTVLIAILLAAPSAVMAQGLVVEHELGSTTLPGTPERVVVFDFGSLDTLDVLGVDIVGLPKGGTIPQYLSKYQDAKYATVGTLTQPDLERVYALKPDLIIISTRQASFYEELSRIAPTIYLAVDTARYMESFKENARTLGRIFNKREQVEEILAEVEAQVAEVQKRVAANRASALVTLVNDKSVSAYGPGSRFGLIHDVFGFTPASRNIVASTHGQPISFEFILSHDPDFLFVVDRGAVVAGQATAKQVMENQLVRFTKAYRNDKIIYLNPEYWYLSGGGLLSVPAMVEEVLAALD